MFRSNDRIGLGSLYPPAALCAHDEGELSPRTRCFAFWLRPASTFGLLFVTAFIESSHVLAMPSTLAPCRLMLAATPSPRGSDVPR